MTQRVVRSIRVRRPVDEVAAFVTDPHRVLPVVPGFARFAFVGSTDGAEEWDVFLEIGTLHVGGRVEVTRPSATHLSWRSDRGTWHRFDLVVEPLADDPRAALVRMEIEYALSGLLMAAAVVVSDAVVSRITSAERLALSDLGEHELRGIPSARRLWALASTE